MSNKKLGTDFENELCEILSNKGFWVHSFVPHKNGQPADVIAIKNGKSYLIECKVMSSDKLPLKRIEENQKSCTETWAKTGNGSVRVAIKHLPTNTIYITKLDGLLRLDTKTVDISVIHGNSYILDRNNEINYF